MVVTSIGLINITLKECHTGRNAFLSEVTQFWEVFVVSQETKVDFPKF